MADTVEVWLPVLDYEGIYEASNLGRVRRVSGAVLKPASDDKGYARVSLSRDGVVRNYSVHRVVLMAFCGREPFEGAHAAHNDGAPSNNRLSNLRWATPVENQADVDRHGRRCRGEDVFGAVLTEPQVAEIRDLLSAGHRNRPIAERFGVSISTIHLIRHNRIWRHVHA